MSCREPMRLLLDCEVPYEPGMRAVVPQHYSLSECRCQAVTRHANIISGIAGIPEEVNRRFCSKPKRPNIHESSAVPGHGRSGRGLRGRGGGPARAGTGRGPGQGARLRRQPHRLQGQVRGGAAAHRRLPGPAPRRRGDHRGCRHRGGSRPGRRAGLAVAGRRPPPGGGPGRPATIVPYAAEPANPELRVRACMTANLTLKFVLLYGVPMTALDQAAADITAALAPGELSGLPVHKYPLADIAAAHQAAESAAVGKVIVTL